MGSCKKLDGATFAAIALAKSFMTFADAKLALTEDVGMELRLYFKQIGLTGIEHIPVHPPGPGQKIPLGEDSAVIFMIRRGKVQVPGRVTLGAGRRRYGLVRRCGRSAATLIRLAGHKHRGCVIESEIRVPMHRRMVPGMSRIRDSPPRRRDLL